MIRPSAADQMLLVAAPWDAVAVMQVQVDAFQKVVQPSDDAA
jgi:hypothetical protein